MGFKSPEVIREGNMRDYAGRQGRNTVFGDTITGQRRPDILVQFQYGISTADVTVTSTGTGVASATNAVATISTGASAGTLDMESVSVLRYQPGFDGETMFTAAFSAADADTYQQIGPHDASNGFWLGQVDGVFTCGARSGGVDKTVTPTMPDWFNPANSYVYYIDFGWLGVSPIYYEIYGGIERGWVPIAIYEVAGEQSTPSIIQPVQPITAAVGRGSGSGAVTLKTNSWSGSRFAGIVEESPGDRYGAHYNSKLGLSAEANVFTIRNKATFAGQTNRVIVHLDYFSVAVDGTKNAVLEILRNATVQGTPVWIDHNTANSVVEIDIAGTLVTPDTGSIELPLSLPKVGSERGNIRGLNIHIHPGETLTFAGESINATDVLWATRWHEEF